ncbi:MAG TPA: sigma-70 family RNA polymerase sigma factor [Gemmataceae bacterium]|nr:sigma-70 family RNA polymerase sigma factor [Gemmataceae bacterium]
MATGLKQVLEYIQHAGGGQTDAQLLARFVATRDEAAFASLVRRHGPMVLGVCRRVLGHFHDAEDAFQAAFLVLARKAASVFRRDSVSCYLHGVAYHTALRARTAIARRRKRERQVDNMPHPEVAPPEAQDWLPLLDRELNRLPKKYRSAIVLCDLEARTRREAARLLNIAEGTLSSRLATGRQMLARRLARCGATLSGGALAVALSQGAASAQVPMALASSTAEAAALVAAGQMTAVPIPVVVLMKGVIKAMLFTKLRLAVGVVTVMVALGTLGLGYQRGSSGAAQAAPPDKSLTELEGLRKENELLRLNLQIVLEKVGAQESELRILRGQAAASKRTGLGAALVDLDQDGYLDLVVANDGVLYKELRNASLSDAAKEAEDAIKALRAAKDKQGQRRAAESLDKAMKKLREQLK